MATRPFDRFLASACAVLALGAIAACGSDARNESGHKAVDLTGFISTDVTNATPSSCGSVTVDGECSGDTYRHCANGTLVEDDCTADGLTCQLDNSGTAGCASGNSCGSVDSFGDCNGDIYEYCDDNGMLVTEDCAAEFSYCNDDPFFGPGCA